VYAEDPDRAAAFYKEALGWDIQMAVPGVGWLAYFSDTEGNVFGMMEPDESASLR